MAAAAGVEPTKSQSQSLLPYRLATPLWFKITIFFNFYIYSITYNFRFVNVFSDFKLKIFMACLGGFEPPTGGLEDRYSIQMSYRHIWWLDSVTIGDPRIFSPLHKPSLLSSHIGGWGEDRTHDYGGCSSAP